MSNRVMNTVFSCVSYLNVKIRYRDTDSMYLNYDDVDTIVDMFKQHMTNS